MPTDTTTSYSDFRTLSDGQIVMVGRGINTSRSTMANGRIDLTAQNPHVFDSSVTRYNHVPTGPSGYFNPPALGSGNRIMNPHFDSPFWLALEQTALSRFNGRLKTGSASLGVTLASWRQSREMITTRLKQADIPLKAAEMQFRRASKKELNGIRRSLTPDSLASKVLEVEFGWRPLFQDIHAATSTVCKDGIPPAFIVGRARSPDGGATVRTAGSPPWTPPSETRYQGTGLVTVAASVAISNPNLWLSNRLGLINPLVVAWDLVPWSFLVNMFLNVNQVLESFTAHVGLEISKSSVTRSSSAVRTSLVGPVSNGYVHKGWSSSVTGERSRRRLVGSIPTRRLTVRVPELNWELALIASSLIVQRVTRINKLLFS